MMFCRRLSIQWSIEICQVHSRGGVKLPTDVDRLCLRMLDIIVITIEDLTDILQTVKLMVYIYLLSDTIIVATQQTHLG